MKKFLVFKKLEDGTPGVKIHSYEAEVVDPGHGALPHPFNPEVSLHFELPEGMLEDEVSPVLVGEAYELQVDAGLQAAKVAAGKAAQILAAYNEMNDDVLAEMASVFGTTKPESATAFERTWALMVEKPQLFSAAGLVDDLGAPMDTDQKILDFATAKMAAVEAYGVSRMQRIQQFQAEKLAIQNS